MCIRDRSNISLQSGNSLVVRVPDLRRIAVGDGKIAGVVSVGNSEVLISGRAPGQTTVILWSGSSGQYVYSVNVTDPVLDRLSAMLRAAITDKPEHLDRCWLELDQKRKLRMVDGEIGLPSPEPVIS